MAEGGANNATACTGGKGGDGGSGGKGGGGRGGHSFAVAYTGDAPDVKGASITTGTPGSGGTGDGDTGKGADGLAARCFTRSSKSARSWPRDWARCPICW